MPNERNANQNKNNSHAYSTPHNLLMVWLCGVILLGCNTTSSRIPFSKEEYRAKNESLLYVFRERAFVGGGVQTVFFLDGISIGLLPQNGYYPVHTVAGKHRLRGCSASLVASEDCKDLEVELTAHSDTAIQIVMYPGDRRFEFERVNDLSRLTELKNEGNYYDPLLRDNLVQKQKRKTLSASSLGKSGSNEAAPLKIAILNFSDGTNSTMYGWLSPSLADAIDLSMRRDFEYRRPNPQAAQSVADKSPHAAAKQLAGMLAADLVITGRYTLNSDKTTVHIEAQLYFAGTDSVLGSEEIDSAVDAQIFDATKKLSEKIVHRLHQLVRVP